MIRTTSLAIILSAVTAFGQLTNTITIDPSITRDVNTTHKAYGQQNLRVTISGVTVADHLPAVIGFKAGKADTTFFATATGSVYSANVLTFSMPATSWATNITKDTTFFGDIRLNDYDLPLPSILLTLKPSYNWGSESYIGPTVSGYETNGNLIASVDRINFGSGFTPTYTTAGSIERLTLTVAGGDTNTAAYIETIAGALDTTASNNLTTAYQAADSAQSNNLTTAYTSADTSQSNIAAAARAAYLPLAGGTMTGNLLFGANSVSGTGSLAGGTVAAGTESIAPIVRAATSAGLRLEDDGDNLGLFVQDGGNVGIGTASPGHALDIGGWAGDPGDVSGGDVVQIAGDIVLGQSVASGDSRMRVSGSANASFLEHNGYWNGSQSLSFDNTDPSLLFRLNGSTDDFQWRRAAPSAGALSYSTLMTLEGDTGNLGIGTSTPQADLHVVNSSSANITVDGALNAFLRLDKGNASRIATVDYLLSGAQKWGVGMLDSSFVGAGLDYGITKDTSASAVKFMIAYATGNVAIGTNTASTKLTINWDNGRTAGFFQGTTDADITGTYSCSPDGTVWYQWVDNAGAFQSATNKP